MNHLKSCPSEKKGERGAILALTAISLLALVLAVGLAVDISHFYVVQTEMQNAADAAALSGASGLDSKVSGIQLAQQRAIAGMNNYEFNNRDINFDATPDNVYFSSNFVALETFLKVPGCPTTQPPDEVKTAEDIVTDDEAEDIAEDIRYVGVCVPAPAATGVFFAQAVSLIDDENPILQPITQRGWAIAGQSPPLTGLCDIVAPMGLVDDPAIDNATEFVGTKVYDLRQRGGGQVSPGNYQLLEICGTGGNNVRDALLGNCSGCFSIGDTVPPKTGVTQGPVRQGWNARFDSDLIIANNIDHDTYLRTKAQYESPSTDDDTFEPGDINADGSYGRRIIIVPSIDKAAIEACNGSNCLFPITGFYAFFLQARVPNGNTTITAEFISEWTVPSGEYGGGGTPIPAATMPVLYR